MDEIPVSKFKATCSAVLDVVARTGRSVTITKRGKAIAEVSRPAATKAARRKLGFTEGELGDYDAIVGPSGAFSEEETLKEWDEFNQRAQSRRGRSRS